MNTKQQEKWILYSTCDEDSNSELRALDVTPEDRVVSVTGSGCRTLSLLTRNPRSVVSVDYSPGQNYLLDLKLAAIRSLEYDTLLAFFGVDACNQRWGIFQSIANQISPNARAYFERHKPAIEKGVLFSGRHERFYVRVVAPMMHVLFGRDLDQIFRCHSLEEQRRIYQEKLNGRLWRFLLRNGFSESTLRLILNDNKYHIEIHVPSVGGYVLERVHHTFLNHLAKDNHWLTFMLKARYLHRRALPHFLLEENCKAIRRASTEVNLVTDNLINYLKTLPSGSVDKFSLSDVTSCIDRTEYEALLDEVARTGRPGARLCYRNFLAKHCINSEDHRMSRDEAISSALDQNDLAFVYTFEVATTAAAPALAGSRLAHAAT